MPESEQTAYPCHTAFMHPDMWEIWNALGPLPGDLRLYGGTALALYLNHRTSVDFNFATPEPVVRPSLVRQIPRFSGTTPVGGPGMVDLTVEGLMRHVKITFMECGTLVPLPSRDPILAANGVAIAHPIDLTAARIAACLDRSQNRDYHDVSHAVQAWPTWSKDAVQLLLTQNRTTKHRLAATLTDPPHDPAHQLTAKDRAVLQQFARKEILGIHTSQARSM